MTSLSSRFGYLIAASVIAGLVVWWFIVASIFVVGTSRALTDPASTAGASVAASLGGMLLLGAFGSIYALFISFCCGLACSPVAMPVIGLVERRRWAGPWVCTLSGGLSALLTAVLAACLIAAVVYARGRPQPFDSLGLLLSLSIGGPFAGFAYWRLARREILAAQANP